MSILRSLLLDNLGLKFVALLLALLVYFNARTDRPVTLLVSFPVAIQDLADSVSIAGPTPTEVRAEIRGTGKRVIRLMYDRPPLAVSLAGVGPGHFERSVNPSDLPLTAGLEVERLVGPRMLVLDLDRRVRRRLPVASRLEWAQPAAARPIGRVRCEPSVVTVSGPATVVARLDSVRLAAMRVDGRQDTARAEVGPGGLPATCTMEPPTVRVTVVLGRAEP